jgi:hypothetical protein
VRSQDTKRTPPHGSRVKQGPTNWLRATIVDEAGLGGGDRDLRSPVEVGSQLLVQLWNDRQRLSRCFEHQLDSALALAVL